MTIILIVLGLAIVAVITGSAASSIQFGKEVKALFSSRHMGEGKLETWVGKVSNYKQLNGIFIPTTIEAIYKLQEGDYSYARFTVKKIQYGIPEKF